MCRWLWVYNLYLSSVLLGFSLSKALYNFVDNVGLNSVSKEMRKTHFKKVQAMSFTGHSWLGLSHKVNHEIQPNMRLFIFQHVILTWPFAGYPLASQSRTSLSSQVFTKLSHSTLTLNLTKILGNDWAKYNQIWYEINANKNIVVNHNFIVATKEGFVL